MVESSTNSRPVVTITGVSGYIGSQICLLFLKEGGYRVKGTVRSKNNEKKIEPIRKAFGDHFEQLELVEADLLDDQSMHDALAGSTFVVHVASPAPIDMVKDENELIKPALGGTIAVLKACKAHKVKRLVITSSIDAIVHPAPEDRPQSGLFDETCWSNPLRRGGMDPYEKSKVLAEKAAWDFVEGLPEQDRFELVTICPGFVLGPILCGPGFASGRAIEAVVNAEYPGLPRVSFPIVDVREVALAHLQAVRVPEAKNQRFIVAGQLKWFTEMAEILSKEFRPQGYKFATRQFPKFVFRFLSIFSQEVKTIVMLWDVETHIENAKSKEILKIDYRPVEQTLHEMVYSMIEQGQIPDKRQKDK